ncbi:MAG: cupin domain-containing protein [Lachnospiraceae bacterium]|nr:cupin domain-containing protein [Robinsoniella sp.]MDY3765703.1 cupin domain-containing protein [Lachnospiraceae bacterium]
MSCGQCAGKTDNGPNPYVTNIEEMAAKNPNFRTAIWTGCHMQMTLMCIPPCGEIGLEVHEDTDQLIRVEQGRAVVEMGLCEKQSNFHANMCTGDAVFVPAGTWHNIINIGRTPLKISSVYAPAKHPRGTIHPSKADAEREDYKRYG